MISGHTLHGEEIQVAPTKSLSASLEDPAAAAGSTLVEFHKEFERLHKGQRRLLKHHRKFAKDMNRVFKLLQRMAQGMKV